MSSVAKRTGRVLASLLLSAGFVVAMQPSLMPAAHAASELAESASLVGKAAPDFTLADTYGKERKLSDYKGKIVVLEWFNFGCPFVKKHYESSNMQKLQKEYTGKGVVWLSINSSAPGKEGNETNETLNKLFKEHKGAPTAVLPDPDGKVGHLYGARSTPDMYVIDKKGVLVYAGAIDDKPTADQADIATAKNYVREALDAELGGKKIATASTKSYGCSVKYAK